MLSYGNLVWMGGAMLWNHPRPPLPTNHGPGSPGCATHLLGPTFVDHSQPMGQGGSPPYQRARDADLFPSVGGPGSCPRRPGADRWREHEDTRRAGATAAEMGRHPQVGRGFSAPIVAIFRRRELSGLIADLNLSARKLSRHRRSSQCDASQCWQSALRFQPESPSATYLTITYVWSTGCRLHVPYLPTYMLVSYHPQADHQESTSPPSAAVGVARCLAISLQSRSVGPKPRCIAQCIAFGTATLERLKAVQVTNTAECTAHRQCPGVTLWQVAATL